MLGLAALLPGVRELRTPVAVGTIWLLWATALFYPQSETLTNSAPFTVLRSLAQEIPDIFTIGALGLFAYLIGVLNTGLISSLPQTRVMKALHLRLEQSTLSYANRAALRLMRPNHVASDLLRSAIRERLLGTSRFLADILPVDLVTREFHLAALRLAKDSPEQYQEYDRTAAEGQFRTNVALPLLVLGVTLAIGLPWALMLVIAIATLLFSAVLFVLGIEHHHRADELLASAIYFGHTSTPLLDALTESAIVDLPSNRKDPDAYDLAWLGEFLGQRHMQESYVQVLSKLRHPSRDMVDTIHRAVPFMSERTLGMLRRVRLVPDD